MATKRLNVFERYLSVWVGLCMVAGVAIGHAVPALTGALRSLEFGQGSQINVPIAVLIWLMITPMMMKVDFAAVRDVGRRPRGLFVTLFVNWVVKPFSMAAIAWLFFRVLFASWIPATDADQYIAGTIILAAAPCTAMVFVWSRLSDGDPYFTLSQVALNDFIMIFAFAPLVALLLGLASITGIGVPLATKIVAEREASGPYRDLRDLVRRTGATAAQLEAALTPRTKWLMLNSPGNPAGGVYSADELRALGIESVHDLPGVGAHLHDHIDAVQVMEASQRTDLFGLSLPGAWRLWQGWQQWRRERRGMLTTNFAESGAFIRSRHEESRPDLQLHFVIAQLVDHGRQTIWGHGYSCHVCVLRPQSRGQVRLASLDPTASPLIDPAFLSDPDDVQRVLDL